MGVRRALNIVLTAANDPSSPTPVCTDGPLIHNRQVLELLEKKGIRAIGDDEPEAAPGTLVIRAHGVTPQHREGMERISRKVVNATCPHVMRVQKIIAKYTAQGYDTIIVGDAGHAEVNGLLGFAEGRGYVIGGPAEVETLPKLDRVIVVAQTTQSHEVFNQTVERLKGLYPDAEVFETICNSTSDRQEEVLELCKRVDAMIVVGGLHSANTCRLAEISRETGTPTFHVETDEDLAVDEVSRYETVGVTAGASTPQWMIKRVVDKLRRADSRQRHRALYVLRQGLGALTHSGIYIGAGAVSLAYANYRLLTADVRPTLIAAAGLFVLGMTLLNHHKHVDAINLNEPEKGRFCTRYRRLLLALCIGATAGSAALGFAGGGMCGVVVLLGVAAGLLYRVSVPSPLARMIKYKRLELIPGSKELFFSAAWTVLTCGLPYLADGLPLKALPVMTAAAVLTFLLVFTRTILLDMKDIEGDQIVGQETVPVTLGAARTRRLLYVLMGVMALAIGYILVVCRQETYAYAMLATFLYCIGYVVLYNTKRLPQGELAEGMVDAGLFIPGLFMLAAGIIGAGSGSAPAGG